MLKKLLLLFFLFFSLNTNAQDFTAIWNTANTNNNSTADNQIEIPTNPAFTNYNYTVDWGDGNIDTNVTGNITHTYAAVGTYNVSISGVFPAIYFNDEGDRLKIEEILSWGNIQWLSMENAFYGCENLNFDAIAPPDLSQVTSLRNMFRDCSAFNGIVNNWNVSNITNISGTFAGASIFNRPVDNWNTSSITDMSETFAGTGLFNEPLDSWNTNLVTTMAGMFSGAGDFNQNIDNWNVNQVTNMSFMFSGARVFNMPLNSWNVANVNNMSGTFNNARLFNQPLDNWDVSNVTDMSDMFNDAREFNQSIGNWDVGSVTNMSEMFDDAAQFNQQIGTWNVTNVTDMTEMFRDAGLFNQPLNNWDVSNVITMSGMFREADNFNQPLDNWNVANVTDMSFMFMDAFIFNQSIDTWDVGNVTNMQQMFDDARAFNQSLSSWDVQLVENMSRMFTLTQTFNQPLNTWITNSLTDISGLFFNAIAFNQPLDNWNITNVSSLNNSFRGATAFNQNLGSWDISNINSMSAALDNCGMSLENYDNTLIGWSIQSVQNNVSLGANGLEYCDSLEERQNLIDTNGWSITGDSVNCSFVLCTNIISPIAGDTNVPANSNIVWEPAPNADGYNVTLEVERNGVRSFVNINGFPADNLDIGNVTTINFTNEFLPGDIVFITVVPYNAEGPAEGCQETQFTTVESWVNNPNSFKLTYDTSIQVINQTTPVNQLKIETSPGITYNYSIDWGDGQYDNNVSADIIHTYLVPGVYTVSIIGDFPAPRHEEFNSDAPKLLSIDQWGTYQWQSMQGAFAGCTNMEYLATDIPDLSNVTDMGRMFIVCRNFNGNINNWDVSNVTNMFATFGVTTIFDQPLNSWNTTNVTNMSLMFFRTDAFNQNINGWNVGNVVSMDRMFENANAFNQPLNGWNVSSVTNMDSMFQGAAQFNQPLNNWDVSNVTNMEDMFQFAINFDGIIGNWDVNAVTNMARMFRSASNFNQPINDWNVQNVLTMSQMFESANTFNQPLNTWLLNNVETTDRMFSNAISFNQPIGTWNVESVLNMSSMFRNATSFNQNINTWNVTNVINMASMFESATSYNQPLDSWDVNSVVNMSSMFENAAVFNQPINTWDVSAVSSTVSMFQNAIAFNQPLDNWDVSSVTLMNSMFQGASIFNNPLNTWTVASVTNMQSMFEEAFLFNQPLDNWDTGEVLNMSEMFKNASVFNQNIDTWNVSYVTTMQEMFSQATNYNQTMDSWNVASVTTMEGMFFQATAFNSPINSWNVRRVLTMEDMFFGATSFNQILNNWRVSGVETMRNMFRDATSYNQIMDAWTFGNVNMQSMFSNASAFNQNLGVWDIESVNNVSNMLDNSGLIRENYDATLIAWSNQNLTPGLNLGANTLLYCDALQQRQSIIDNFGWSINGDILDCPIPECTQLVLPLNNATNVPVNTNIAWEDVLFASGYTLEIEIQPSGVIINETLGDGTTYNFASDFTGGETVTVTIIPFNDEGSAVGPCTSESFTISNDIATIPDCTQLTIPTNGSSNIMVDTNLSWSPITNANGYILNVTTNPAGVIIVNNEDVGNITTYNIPTDLPEETLIDVTITPYNDEGNAVNCNTESFTTQTIPRPPSCTSMTNPLNDAIDVPIDTNITWDLVPEATGYLISIGETIGGIEIANNIDVGNFNFYDIPNDLDNSRRYYVTIIPYNAVGDATNCIEESFTTVAPTPTNPVCTNLTSPVNGATNIATNLNQITWDAATNATSYRITISGTANNDITDFETTDTFYNFTNPFVNGEVVNVFIVPFNTLEDAVGCTSESFTIIPTTPACTNLTSPVDGAVEVETTLNQITWNAVADATAYSVTVSGTANNNVTNFETTDTFFDFTNPFLNDEVVTVTIIPINVTVQAENCTSESFTIIPETPDCTSLSAPLNGDTDIATDLNQITWNPVTSATSYTITISGTANNNVTDFETTDTFFNFTNPFVNSETVTVTITPINGNIEAVGCTSESFTFIPTTPDCTNLTSPVDGAVDVETTLNQITWNPVADATAYSVTVSGTANNNVTNFETTNTFFDFANPFLNDEIVTVTIIPINVTVQAENCTSESFTIIPETPDCTSLSTPLNGDTDIATDLNQINWNPVSNATSYTITISGTANNNVTDFETTDTFFNFTNPFLVNEIVSVSITPKNGTIEAINCTTETFDIVKTPRCTILNNPENEELDVELDVQLTWNEISEADGYLLSIGTTSGGVDLLDNFDVGLVLFYDFEDNLDGDTTYYVTITAYNANGNAIGCEETVFTTLTPPKNDVKYGFSPDGDGINEFWNITGIEEHPQNKVMIYNRWGDLVFEIDNYNNTTNVFRGIANRKTKMGAGILPEGTYFFQFVINEPNNFETLKGYVVIKR
ncbi:BspA family leucine-rich repeat surface protein [Winogradskyella litorisediminis]|uniref:BspA family leucine-rich repeat surface protein n=1 Tax=Winogradskyella litorisediminis TaxID=1156618 RepID=A0ABW3N700_9FLAO